MSTTLHEINGHTIAKVKVYATNPTIKNYSITLIAESYGEDGIYYPAQDVTFTGESIARLRNVLAELPSE